MSLRAGLEAFAKKAKIELEAAHRLSIIKVVDSLVFGSAVDTGRFRSNWVGGVNSVNTYAGHEPESADATRTRLLGSIPPVGGVYYITNSLPYARRLEYEGWSQQMPAGIVRITAMQYNTWLAEAIR